MTYEEREQRAKVESLVKLVEEGIKDQGLLSKIELETEEEKQKLGQRLIDEKLQALPPEYGGPHPCPKCKSPAPVRSREVPRTFKSLSGTHTYKRNYHYCEACRAGFFPRDEELGILKGSDVSTETARRMADFFLNDPFEVCEERWSVHYPSVPASPNQFRQLAEKLGKQIEDVDDLVLQTALKPPEPEPAKILYIQTDGSMVSMQSGEWREVKSAVIFSEDKHLRGDEEKRGALLDPRFVSVMGSQDEFKKALKPALQVANAVRAAMVIWLADGAKGNWSLASLLAPTATQILDWFHAAKHASDCAKILFDEDEACANIFRQRIESLLIAGYTKLAIQELTACLKFKMKSHQRKALKDLIGYYGQNECRMHYDKYIRNGWLIGSGAIEATHRHVIQARMKNAGQHWGERGGRRMARMRAAYKTAGARRFFASTRWAVRDGSSMPKPKKLRASNR